MLINATNATNALKRDKILILSDFLPSFYI